MRESIASLKQHDANTDSGYGRSSDRLHKPRQTGSHFPYKTPDVFEDLDDIDLGGSEDVIGRKYQPHVSSDPLAFKGTTPFYYTAGNTKLSDCFDRPDEVLREVESTVMTPGSARRTGTTRGWASPPPAIGIDDELEEIEPDEDYNPLDWVLDDPHQSWIWTAK